MFVVSGAWLDDRHGVSTAGLGFVATGFGAAELVASMSAAAFSDRIGLRRSVLIGLSVLGLGLVIAAASGPSQVLAIAGLIVFLMGFEFAFVTSLSLVTEAAPLARGRAIGAGNALGTLARSVGRPRQRAALRQCRHRWLVRPVSRRGDDRRRPHRVRLSWMPDRRSPRRPPRHACSDRNGGPPRLRPRGSRGARARYSVPARWWAAPRSP